MVMVEYASTEERKLCGIAQVSLPAADSSQLQRPVEDPAAIFENIMKKAMHLAGKRQLRNFSRCVWHAASL